MQPVSSKRPRRPSLEADEASTRRIPCKRCRSRKVKCGGEYPSCLGCTKADVPCIVADFSAPRDYTREEVQQLESKIHRLEALLASNPPPGSAAPDAPDSSSSIVSPRFVGPESGVGFFLSTLEAFQGQSRTTATSRLLHLPQPSSAVNLVPHAFPSFEFATRVIREYFRECHLAHPFLDETQVGKTLCQQSSLACSSAQADKVRLFQLNMVLAIGSVRLFRDGSTDLHPFGFFMAALEASPPSSSSFSTLEDVENMLLIARFGAFYNIGCSLWDLGRLCIRMAIELNLHQEHPDSPLDDSPEGQRRLRVFWDSYLLDRLSSSTLGRPFAIEDYAIGTSLPRTGPGGELSPFNWLIGLGQITSRIHCSVNERRAGRGTVDTPVSRSQLVPRMAKMYSALRLFHSQLDEWRKGAPSSANPTCMYEADDFFELSYQETRLWLLRVTMEGLSSDHANPSASILRPCLQAACGIIDSFDRLRAANLVLSTRTHMHLIFIASLVVVAITHLHLPNHQQEASAASLVDLGHWLEDLDDGTCSEPHVGCEVILPKARGALRWLAGGMPDVAVYARIFDALEQDLSKAKAGPIQNQHPGIGTGDRDDAAAVPRVQQSPEHSPSLQPDYGLVDTGRRFGMEHHLAAPDHALHMAYPTQDPLESMQYGHGGLQASHDIIWPLSDFLGIEGLDLDMSSFVWDMARPWEQSPPMP